MTERKFDYDLKGLHLVFCIPDYDEMLPADLMVSFVNTSNMLRDHGVTTSLELRSKSALIEKVRGELLYSFLANKAATHLLFVDSDIVWKPEDAVRLLAFCTEYDAVCGPYCTKEDEPTFHYKPKPSPQGKLIQNDKGLIEINAGPIGFNCFSRKGLQQVVDAFPELHFYPSRGDMQDAKISGVFCTEIHRDASGKNRFIGEDIAFYNRWRKAGLQAWLDPSISLRHIGRKHYTKDYLEFLVEHQERHDMDSAA